EFEIQVQGEAVPLTNLDKILWPETSDHRALTKRDLLKYFAECSDHILRHAMGRPLTLLRFPDGIEKQRFFQRHWPHKLPQFVETVRVYTEDAGEDKDFILCNNLPTLLWLGQI